MPRPFKAIPVRDFQTVPKEIPVAAKEFNFSYEDSKTFKEYEYDVKVKGGDLKSFHEFVTIILDCKKKNILPWPAVAKIKNKVTITDPNAEAIQMELPLKVAHNFLSSL
jgi:hypothetical protein